MKRLLIDSTFLINELKRKRPPHGIPRVILAYLRHYHDTLHLVYRVRKKIFILPQCYSKEITRLVLLWDATLYKKILRFIIKGIFFAEKIKPDDTYFFLKLDQNGMKYPAYFEQLEKMGIKTLIMIHDLFPITHPEYSDRAYAVQFEQNIQKSLKHADSLICVSQSTQAALAQYVQTQNISCPISIAAPLAPGFIPFYEQQERAIDGPYFVIISTIVARKNHLLLLHIWRKLADQLKENTPKLVIIGKRSSECSSTLAMLDRCQQLEQSVIEITATDEELQRYLMHTKALLFPTFAEGYGLPLMEALNAKIPVICSDLDVFREMAQDIPDYLDPLDGAGWMNLIKEYMQQESAPRTAQLKRLSQFKVPSWDEHFAKIDLFLN
jgi:glycosyltransferase involved in cell wall biosynthesis